MIPMLAVDVIFILTALLVLAVFANGVYRFWRDMDAQHSRRTGLIPRTIEVINEIITHKNFKECGTNTYRYLGHLGIFYGFVALFIVTTCIFLGVYFLNLIIEIPLTPWPWWNPVKILANCGAIVLLAGCFLVIRNRLHEDKDTTSSYFDWLLVWLVLLVGATGLVAEIVRWIGIGVLYYLLYFAHLVLVWSLIAYSPYSKLAHLVYRTVALIHANASGRNLKENAEVRRLTVAGSAEA
jgi:quinone-modifying oxidoreductase subunit QmoC